MIKSFILNTNWKRSVCTELVSSFLFSTKM
nr:MAG TPA_asm: hypothetical protein [Caudoviricetes sp.]